MKKFFFILLIITYSFCPAQNKTNEIILEIKNISADAYFKNDMEGYRQAIDKCEQLLKIDSSNNYAKYYLAYNQFNLVGVLVTDSTKKTEFEKTAMLAESYLQELSTDTILRAESFVVLEGLYTILLNVYPSKKKELMAKVGQCFVTALEADSANPRIYLHSGIFTFFTAKKTGRPVELAIRDYKKALSLFEKNETKNELLPDWGFVETLAFLGRAYEDIGKLDIAEKVYDTALQIRPDFVLINKVFYPLLKKKKGNK